MLRRLAGPRRWRRAELGLAVLLLWIIVLWMATPYDSPLLLGARFVAFKALSFLRDPLDDAWWLRAPTVQHIDLSRDVALVIKTGYGTRARVLAQLDAGALLLEPGKKGVAGSVLVIGDFAAKYTHNGREVEIHDVVAAAVKHDALTGLTMTKAVERRLKKYANMTRVVRDGKAEDAEILARRVGWELDAMKFIPGLELAYRRMPGKKWYILQDDDTYFIRPTLESILARLDPSQPMYLGNGVGDFKGRFAHGGSGIVLSHGAMSRLFDQHPEVVREAYLNALTEVWGDKLLATTLMKIGVYLDEWYGSFFNGERPTTTRIRPDHFCSPLVSFHELKDPSAMAEVGRRFRFGKKPVSWGQLWKMYGQADLDDFERRRIRINEDHVGRTDEHTTTDQVDSADECLAICEAHHKTCIAWTWDKQQRKCHISPWMIIGEKTEGKYSGLNVPRIRSLMRGCTL
ncbi:Family 31 glycosyltransferase [Pleurostoma richardsiae]|uniref:N-acetylgalactosaminide beta-1,3-galactosyltransferase n=1 Tax=Pleurostoma richardsiae TaxID=41990 RepID=A0AA38S737_9PEZI|nr:Family 31 glycosyltransferase [Pleurostoma richardsiae]